MQLGSLNLVKEIGRGGMASVWLAEHMSNHLRFAIKIMHPKLAENHDAHQRFLNEVRAISQLKHRSIIKLYDYGLISHETNEAIDHVSFKSGSPYCVMAYHAHGTYKSPNIVNNWIHLKDTLSQIIEAVSLIHAHGIIHCDLKPSNILQGDNGPIVSDFGIIYHQNVYFSSPDIQKSKKSVSGTPSYMSPEQILSKHQSIGPWTDLYAIAGIAYYLAAGHPPYNAPLEITRIYQHLEDPVPKLKALFPIPKGFEEWIHWCMDKDPTCRPNFAIEALNALQSIPSTYEQSSRGPTLHDDRASNHININTKHNNSSSLSSVEIYDSFGKEALLRRTLPMIGQTNFQTDFERIIADLHRSMSQLMLVNGESGIGKSSILKRALIKIHREGIGEGLKLLHEPYYSDLSGIAGMLRQLWDSSGQSREELLDCLKTAQSRRVQVQSNDIQAMVSWIKAPLNFADYAKRSARISAFSRWIHQRSIDYPQIVVIDDAQWANEALIWANQFLAKYKYSAVLIIVCSHNRYEVIEKLQCIDKLNTCSRFTEHHIQSLNRQESDQLVDSYFPLEDELKTELYEREVGHPLRSLQRMRYWMKDDLLQLVNHQKWAWVQQTKNLDSEASNLQLGWAFNDQKRVYALEIAALLGQSFLVKLWKRLCRTLDCEHSQRSLSLLVSKGILGQLDDHYMYFLDYEEQATLIQQAESSGRAQQYHRLIAEELEQDLSSHPSVRLRHWLAASAFVQVKYTAEELIRFAIRTDQYEFLAEGFKAWIISLRQRGVKLSSPDWLSLKLAWAERCVILGHNHSGRRHAFHLIQHLRLVPPSLNLFHALLQCTQAQKWDLTRTQQTLELCHEAWNVVQQIGNAELQTQCLDRLAVFYHTYGQLDLARTYFNQALSLSHQSTSTKLQATIHLGIARLCLEEDLLSEANQHCQYALNLIIEDEYQSLRGSILLTAGDIARQENSSDQALLYYEEATRLLDSLGAPEVWAAYLNLALAGYDHKDWEKASQMIIESRLVASRVASEAVVKMVDSCALFGLAKQEFWEEFDATLSHLLASNDHRYAQYDSANTLERLAFTLDEDEECARAHLVWQLTALQFAALGLTERAQIAEAFCQVT
jgi:serine/threonine protein kinase